MIYANATEVLVVGVRQAGDAVLLVGWRRLCAFYLNSRLYLG